MYLNCPRCGLTIKLRHGLAVEHCPRCIAHSHALVGMFASSARAEELYAPNRLPQAEAQDGPESGW